MSFQRLEELEQQLLQARAVAEAALARAAEVDVIWQEYGVLWRKLNPPAA